MGYETSAGKASGAWVFWLMAMAAVVCLLMGSKAYGQAVKKVTTKSATPAQMEAAAKKQLDLQLAAAAARLTATQKQMPSEQLHLMEVTVLRQAYVLLDTANADYDGHRARAMTQVNAAIRRLGHEIAAKGTVAQETENFRQEALRVYYKSLRRSVPAVIEPQAASDAQVYMAGQVLSQLRVVLAANNQRRSLANVDTALIQVILALRTI